MGGTLPVNKEESTTVRIRVFYPLIIVPGMVQVLAPSTINSVMKDMRMGEGLAGLLLLVYFAGLLVGTLLITRLMQKFNVKQILLSQVVLLTLSLLAAAASPSYVLILLCFLVAGFANGILITLPGIYIAGMCGEANPRMQTLLYSFLSIGFMLGPVLPGLFSRWGISWR